MSNIPKDIQSYLTEIAERLWTGHASVMVGAGFSKNAVNLINASKSVPDWNQLGDSFYEKLHGQKPTHETKYLSLLKLAEEFEATFGRSMLEHFIAKNIADDEYMPSEIHKKLIELPWTDIFTTNYDTLLEKSCKEVVSRRYDIVVNQNDLIYSNKPRIIKLHGSLPSERPFVITEEDYRIYPKKYAPFVNTVQQSLLENTLCLIGFSGDDPNFLQWLGWINDNFGKSNSPKIYLIGSLRLSESQKKLLHNKNIIAVDLSECTSMSGSHQKGLEIFINYLSRQQTTRGNLEWPDNTNLKTTLTLENNTNLKSLITEWRSYRQKYPNWVILPRKQRDTLWHYTEEFSSRDSVFERLQFFDELDYIYELNWRLEKCLLPIWNNMAPRFQKVLDNYNLFPKQISEARRVSIDTYEGADVNWDHYKQQWIHLSLSLLRFYREEGYEERWSSTFVLIGRIREHLTSDQIARFYYEQVLHALFKMDYETTQRLLNEWPQTNMAVFWNAKRAMIMTELGQLEEAINILESCLLEIRRKLNLSPIGNDYTWVSQESYIMFQLKMVQSNLRWDSAGDQEKTRDFNERWNDRLQYKCNPWEEKEYFDLMLQQAYVPKKNVRITRDFEIGRSTRSITLGGEPQRDFIIAYTFLRYLEELAIPISLRWVNIDPKTISGVLTRIKFVSFKWGIAILNRYRTDHPVDAIIDRKQLVRLPISSIDSYISHYIELFRNFSPNQTSDYLTNVIIEKIPLILSRLCVKCSEELRLEILQLFQTICIQQLPLPNLDKLLKNLIDTSGQSTLKTAAELLMNTPVPDSKGTFIIEPFDFLKPHHMGGKLEIKEGLINDLFKKAKDVTTIRINAIKRLMFLFKIGHLSKSQTKKFFDIVWEQRSENGFPRDTPYYPHHFIQWPHPKNVDVEATFRNYIQANNFTIQSAKDGNGIDLSKAHDRYTFGLLWGSKTIKQPNGIIWQTEELECILTKCEQWWYADKHYLEDEKYKSNAFETSIYGEIFTRFGNLTEIISKVFGYHARELNANQKSRINILITDMENNAVPVLQAKATFGLFDSYEVFLDELPIVLLSEEKQRKHDAFQSIIISLRGSPYQAVPDFRRKLATLLIIPLQWRITDLICSVFDILEGFIKDGYLELDFIGDKIYSSLQWVLELDIIDDEKQTIELEDALLMKQYSASLAKLIYNKCIEEGITIPEAILNWNKFLEDSNQFADIKMYAR